MSVIYDDRDEWWECCLCGYRRNRRGAPREYRGADAASKTPLDLIGLVQQYCDDCGCTRRESMDAMGTALDVLRKSDRKPPRRSNRKPIHKLAEEWAATVPDCRRSIHAQEIARYLEERGWPGCEAVEVALKYLKVKQWLASAPDPELDEFGLELPESQMLRARHAPIPAPPNPQDSDGTVTVMRGNSTSPSNCWHPRKLW